MRGVSITSGLLILVFATSAFECATGCGIDLPVLSLAPNVRAAVCIAKAPSGTVVTQPKCGDSLKCSGRHCSLRSLAQFQFAEFRRFATSGPLRYTGGRISLPLNPVIILSSIGSAQTDRGPPRS
jgi:hypothetical protein